MDMYSKLTQGPHAKTLLVDALMKQEIVRHDTETAELLANVAEVLAVKKGDILLKQGAADDDVYFILYGSMQIELHDFWNIAVRSAGSHVGEMSLIDPDKPRSASVKALEDCLVAKVAQRQFSEIAEKKPEIWRSIASTLASRLRDRGQPLQPPNIRPRVFIGSASSKEALRLVNAITVGLSYDKVEVTPWSVNVFVPGPTTIETLFEMVEKSDLAIFVATPEDLVRKGNSPEPVKAIRDNVIFELGLFMGALGRNRAFFAIARDNVPDLPSDWLGMTPITYDGQDLTEDNIDARMVPVCQRIRTVLKTLGQRKRLKLT